MLMIIMEFTQASVDNYVQAKELYNLGVKIHAN